MAWYKTGTVNVTNGSRVVTAQGCDFVQFVDVGEAMVGPDGDYYEILQVPSSTELRLARNYSGPTANAQPYSIAPVQGYQQELARKAAALIDLHSGVPPQVADSTQAAEAAAAAAIAARNQSVEAKDVSVSLAPFYGLNPPANPVPNARWIHSDTGDEYKWIVDEDSGQWVETGASISVGYATAIAAQAAAASAAQSAEQARQHAEDSGLASATLDSEYNLIITLGSGQNVVVGYVRGAEGRSFDVDKSGLDLTERDAYNNEPDGFSFLDTTGRNLYIRLGATPGVWSPAIPFGRGEPGTTDYTQLQNKPSFGSAAFRDVPGSGNAQAAQVVLGSDERLSNARQPTAHTHAVADLTDATDTGRSLMTASDLAAARTLLGVENVNNTPDADKPLSGPMVEALASKQAALTSGQNIKTINGQSLLGSGNLVIAGGTGGSGDMAKSLYDPDGDGKVVAAASADTVPWAGISGKPATFPPPAHTHALGDISGLSALVGALRIVVLGDSYSAEQPLLSDSWPRRLEAHLRGSGANVDVFNLAINGHTFNKANVTASFGGKTMVQKAVELAPNIVIVGLGNNDATLAVESRTLAQVQADAAATFQALKTGLPNATIVYASEVAYDTQHGVPSTLTNQQVIPFLMQKPTSGFLAGTFCSAMLTSATSAETRTRYGNWAALDTYIKSLNTVSTYFNLDIWKAHRLGLGGYDSIHLTSAGNSYLAACARKAFKTITTLRNALPNLSNQEYPTFDDPDALFNAFLTPSGGKFNELQPTYIANHTAAHFGPWRACLPAAWYLPSKGQFSSSSLSHTSGLAYTWMLTGMPPSTQVETSFNSGAFTAASGMTDARGGYVDSGVIALPAGSYVFHYKVGNEVIGPVTLTVVGTPPAPVTVAPKAIGRLWGLQGNYANAVNAATEVFFSTSSPLLKEGMSLNPGSGAVGPSLVVPRTGLYRITALTLNVNTSANSGGFIRAYAWRAGVGDIQLADGSASFNPLAGGPVMSCIGGVVVNLNAGDAVRIKTFVQGSSTQQNNPDGANTSNYFIVEEV